jgi:hypothetical protein
MINLPTQNHQWIKANNSDLYGNVAVTKNITFDNEGYLKLSNSPRAVMDENIDTDFNNPAVILFNEDYGYFVETWEEAFQVNAEVLGVRPTQIATAGVPQGDIQSDATWFGGLMPVSQDTDLDYYDPSANTWTDTNITLTATSQSQHPIVNFVSLTALAVADVNTVKTYDKPLTATPTLLNTLTISADFYITGMCYFNQNLYIATMNRYGEHAYMYVWNGQGTAAQNAFKVDSNMIFSICVHQDSIVLVTGNGSLLRFNGSGFDPLAHFPIFYTDRALTDETNIGMYKNIMKSNGDILYVLFADQRNTVALLNQPDGVWCYDPNVGLYHRYSLSNSLVSVQTITTASVDATANSIAVASPAFVTGTELYYRANGGTAIAGLTDETKYFAINVDSTHIKFASTKALAAAGTAIDLTGTGNNSQTIVGFPNIDYGQFYNNRTMALCVIERPVTKTQYGTDLIWGGEVNQRALTGNDGMLGSVSSTVESRGYFITPKVFSDSLTDTFDQITLKFSPLQSELDKIIIKYRVKDDMRETLLLSSISSWQATWTSTTTFTTTQAEFATAKVGDEVEFLRGAAAGLLAHITAISGSSTYTVTIDETYDNYTSGDLSTFVFRNWKKLSTITASRTETQNFSNTSGYEKLALGKSVGGKFIQFKIELRGIGVRIEELSVDNSPLIFNRNK